MACDICGGSGKPLESLRDIYQTDEIKDICPDCEKIVNKQLDKIKSMTFVMNQSLLKRFMSNFKKNKDS